MKKPMTHEEQKEWIDRMWNDDDDDEGEGMKKSATPEPLYQPIVPVEDRGKVLQSNYYRINPLSHHLGHPLHPALKECNLRVDFGTDGGIYKVEWTNVPMTEKKK